MIEMKCLGSDGNVARMSALSWGASKKKGKHSDKIGK